MKLGLVGFGFGGRIFHAPSITAADGVELAGVVARSAARRADAAEEYPDVPLYGSLTELLAAGVDAVVITTPPETRRELVLEAIAAGVHVVADKPFAPNAEVGRELVQAAAEAGVILNVFHNRRWDTDIRTLRSVLDSGEVGQVARFESRFDSTSRKPSRPAPRADCFATLAATWWTRRCGSSARRPASMPRSTGRTWTPAAPTPASS